jgi:cytidylate kinase
MLAERLGYALLDTGAIYRTMAWLARRQGLSWEDGPAVAALARDLELEFRLEGGVNRVVANGADITTDVRAPEISDGASRVSALPEVRAALLDLQRRLGAAGGVVVEGRDIGTVVFPHAGAKFYLTATPEERARRRAAELNATGRPADLGTVLAEIVGRDARDMNRSVAPLRRADDAIEIDSSAMGPIEVVDAMVEQVERKLS